MNCPKCGNEINENQNFCSNCGANLENFEENTTENFAEEKSNMDIKNFFKKNLIVIISACVIGLPLIAFGTVKAVDYNKKINPITTGFHNEYGKANITAKYDKRNKEIIFKIIQPDVIVEDWQIEIKDSGPSEAKFVIVAKDNISVPNIEFDKFELISGKPVISYFKATNQTLQDFVNIKYLLKYSQIGYAAPIYISLNKEEIKFARKRYDEVQEQKAEDERQKIEDEKIIPLVQDYAFMYNHESSKVPIDFNPRKCVFKVKGICFGRPFYLKYDHGLPYTECKNEQENLGIKYCSNSKDVFATTAYVCGGVKNMPTPDELILLAQDMYNSTIFNNVMERNSIGGTSEMIGDVHYSFYNQHSAKRNNNKDYLNYFRYIDHPNTNFKDAEAETNWGNMRIAIISNKEDKEKIYGRFYYVDSSNIFATDRYKFPIHNDVFSICVERDKNYVTPAKEKYPVTTRQETEYNNEAENELF